MSVINNPAFYRLKLIPRASRMKPENLVSSKFPDDADAFGLGNIL